MGLASGGACNGLEYFLHPRAAERVVWNGEKRRFWQFFLKNSRHLTQEAQIGTPLPEARDVPDPPLVREHPGMRALGVFGTSGDPRILPRRIYPLGSTV